VAEKNEEQRLSLIALLAAQYFADAGRKNEVGFQIRPTGF
jgi:hypothetical protein